MDIVDKDLEKAETQASPRLDPSTHSPPPQSPTEPVQRTMTVESSVSSSSSGSSSSSVSTAPPGSRARATSATTMSRLPTQPDDAPALERNPTALSRIQTARSQHSMTVGATLSSRRSRRPLPAFGGGKPYPEPLPAKEEYVVEFAGADDPLHAQNWPLAKKLYTGAILGYVTLCSAFGSSIFSAATRTVASIYGVSAEVGILGTSLYVLGFATGPIFWAPLSELKGRRLPLIISSFGFGVFNVAVATGKDLQTILICRFWAGFFGACPLTIVAAVFSDMFNNRTRGIAITVFSMTVFTGPLLAPFIGGFINMSYLGWRWTEYLVAIMGFFGFALVLLFLQETYPPVVLVDKAAELRRRTKNWGIHAKQEEIEVDFRELAEKNFSRPLRMLVTEPIVLLISIYMSFIYGSFCIPHFFFFSLSLSGKANNRANAACPKKKKGLLYLFLTAYPIVFQRIHGFNPGVGGLPYFGMICGQLIAGIFIMLRQPSYQRKLAANNDWPVPEWRLPEIVVGGVAFAAGLFWFGWTGYRADIHWVVPTLSGLCTGFGLMAIFLQSLNYLVDAYLMFAASAIAANTFCRSLCGAGFPLFAQYMFDGLGVNWTGTLLGCVAVVLVPVPVLFLFKGRRIRERSAFAPTPPAMLGQS
ncbi:major facilitator superfamily [Lineolata rhizophorae]|uniref:Major facilitator superfamily n=1 Tax=Lineolata rhizophorae TaxID=578093 RepID=A0A6A6P9Y3_9PEZI|nr:major facilitator superfamily [Lineolata rhizophorae]